MKKIFLISLMFLGLSNNSFAQFKEGYRPQLIKQTPKIEKTAPKPVITSQTHKIIAIVNGEVISNSDIQSRINAFLLNTRIPLNPQTKPMIYQKVLNASIDEKIKLQEAEKNGIIISDSEAETAIKSFQKNNNLSSSTFKSQLKQAGVNYDDFKSQMKSDLAWIRLVRKRIYSEGEVTQKEIETAIADAQKDINTEKYMVSEIFIEKSKAKNLSDLVSNLRSDPRFELYAMQFSDNPSAANGGKLGWVNKGKLPEKLEQALAKMNDGQISEPIALNDGFYILKLEKKFNPEQDKVKAPSQKEVKQMLEGQRMELFAKKHLQDLRQKAVIEVRN